MGFQLYQSHILQVTRLKSGKQSKLYGKICEKCLKRVTRVGVYGSHTQVKCLLKA